MNKVLNTYSKDQEDSEYLRKHIPKDGVDERVRNIESQLSMEKPLPKSIYERLKSLEDRLLFLESISPEYLHIWVGETNLFQYLV